MLNKTEGQICIAYCYILVCVSKFWPPLPQPLRHYCQYIKLRAIFRKFYHHLISTASLLLTILFMTTIVISNYVALYNGRENHNKMKT